ncbi:hypothetical protein N9N67_11625, partial [Bacteriovoracaceae bacterium]|nr:hypothetical protein [Bacteriovoracaceae bacterium]
DSLGLESIDSNDLELKLTLEGWFNDINFLNESLVNGIQAIKESNYILANAWVGECLLHHPELIPKKWMNYADSDWYGPEHGSIRFEGSIFQSKEAPERKIVLSPFMARGRWEYGFEEYRFSLEENAFYADANEGKGMFHRFYHVVIKKK